MNDDEASTGQRELASVLRDLAWTIHRLVPEVAGIEPLPTTELAIIKHVLGSPGTTVTELARQLGMRHSNVSAAVRCLVERGLVAREANPADRRVSRLVPADKALAAKESITAVWSGTIRAAMSQLSDEQVAAIEAASGALQDLDQALHTDQYAPRERHD